MARSTVDQGFSAYGAKLATTAAPYDGVSDPRNPSGDPNDPATYSLRPGRDFLRPWVAIRNGEAFQWPLGVEGFTLTTDPTLGIHKFVGDNQVYVDVIHTGEEHITMEGNFPGNSAAVLVQALRDVVRKKVGDVGKVLYVPEIMKHAQRVQVISSQFSRSDDARGRDMQYTIEFVLMGEDLANAATSVLVPSSALPSAPRTSARSVNVDAKHNTLRKLALWKLGKSDNWRQMYDASETWFTERSITLVSAPDYILPLGTLIYF